MFLMVIIMSRPITKKDAIALNIKITAEIAEALEKISKHEDRTKTSVVERAIKEYLENHPIK